MSLSVSDERALFEGMVDRQRAEIASLLDDLDESEARERLVPSLTTPLGLVKHCTFVEKVWFHARVADVPRAELGIPDEVDPSFVLEPTDTIDSIHTAFLAACERSREIASTHDLDDTFPWYEHRVSLPYIYDHLIAEYARHAGHGDILVEQIRARRADRSSD
ncbi:hypothetical protein Back2_05570 [Nocardioides baekrokdamisoli]|uniref:Mini-circle protein n=1 Tax=Nocardioides baekrokdamisoli TaxID=1804624 RepID=A0A3G9IBM6_9ACTN|nr:DinB family protein [Nocardioides baekrokdamisoli]BBH16270.1 hypothetical protein Back2_05570 [Nocardioides baekrokdamisoli]